MLNPIYTEKDKHEIQKHIFELESMKTRSNLNEALSFCLEGLRHELEGNYQLAIYPYIKSHTVLSLRRLSFMLPTLHFSHLDLQNENDPYRQIIVSLLSRNNDRRKNVFSQSLENNDVKKTENEAISNSNTMEPVWMPREVDTSLMVLTLLKTAQLLDENEGLTIEEIEKRGSISPSQAMNVLNNLILRGFVNEDHSYAYRITLEGKRYLEEKSYDDGLNQYVAAKDANKSLLARFLPSMDLSKYSYNQVRNVGADEETEKEQQQEQKNEKVLKNRRSV